MNPVTSTPPQKKKNLINSHLDIMYSLNLQRCNNISSCNNIFLSIRFVDTIHLYIVMYNLYTVTKLQCNEDISSERPQSNVSLRKEVLGINLAPTWNTGIILRRVTKVGW